MFFFQRTDQLFSGWFVIISGSEDRLGSTEEEAAIVGATSAPPSLAVSTRRQCPQISICAKWLLTVVCPRHASFARPPEPVHLIAVVNSRAIGFSSNRTYLPTVLGRQLERGIVCERQPAGLTTVVRDLVVYKCCLLLRAR